MNQQYTLPPGGTSCFFVATPFNLFNAIAAAMSENRDRICILFFIDQPPEKDNLYIDILREWDDSPFKELYVFTSRSEKENSRTVHRRENFRRLENIIRHCLPDTIYTGNDRRIEYLYSRHIAKRYNSNLHCIYLDDGVLSYVLKKFSFPRYTIIEEMVKKLLFGTWYHRGSIVGCSKYINEAMVAFPEFVHKALAKKRLRQTPSAVFSSTEFKTFVSLGLRRFSLDLTRLNRLDAIQILPHQYELTKFRPYYLRIKEMVDRLTEDGTKIGIKYHPYQKNDPFAFSENPDVFIIPPDIAFELIVPVLPLSTVVVGDVSTVLLTAKWLRPELTVLTINQPDDHRHGKILPLFTKLGIRRIERPETFSLSI